MINCKRFVNLLIGLLLIGNGTVAIGGGGATTVGDGGHLVICETSVDVLDVYERRLLVGRSEIDFGDDETMSIEQMKDVGLARMRSRFKLTEQEFEKIAMAAYMFLKFPVNPWANVKDPWRSWIDPWNSGTDPFEYFLQTKDITVSKLVYDSIKKNYCEIDIAAIKPPKELPKNLDDVYDDICHRSHLARENCFFVSKDAFSMLTKKQKACLAIHESFRYLPENKAFVDEIQMRRAVADICTNN